MSYEDNSTDFEKAKRQGTRRVNELWQQMLSIQRLAILRDVPEIVWRDDAVDAARSVAGGLVSCWTYIKWEYGLVGESQNPKLFADARRPALDMWRVAERCWLTRFFTQFSDEATIFLRAIQIAAERRESAATQAIDLLRRLSESVVLPDYHDATRLIYHDVIQFLQIHVPPKSQPPVHDPEDLKWSLGMTMKEISSHLDIKSCRRRDVEPYLEVIGSKLRTLSREQHQVRLDTMQSPYRERFSPMGSGK